MRYKVHVEIEVPDGVWSLPIDLFKVESPAKIVSFVSEEIHPESKTMLCFIGPDGCACDDESVGGGGGAGDCVDGATGGCGWQQ